MIIHKEKFSAITSGGEWSGNTEDIPGAICQQVYVKSATGTTSFDVTITDDNSINIREYSIVIGCVNDLTPFLVRGKHTIAITSATADEAFDVQLSFREK